MDEMKITVTATGDDGAFVVGTFTDVNDAILAFSGPCFVPAKQNGKAKAQKTTRLQRIWTRVKRRYQ